MGPAEDRGDGAPNVWCGVADAAAAMQLVKLGALGASIGHSMHKNMNYDNYYHHLDRLKLVMEHGEQVAAVKTN